MRLWPFLLVAVHPFQVAYMQLCQSSAPWWSRPTLKRVQPAKRRIQALLHGTSLRGGGESSDQRPVPARAPSRRPQGERARERSSVPRLQPDEVDRALGATAQDLLRQSAAVALPAGRVRRALPLLLRRCLSPQPQVGPLPRPLLGGARTAEPRRVGSGGGRWHGAPAGQAGGSLSVETGEPRLPSCKQQGGRQARPWQRVS
jgi:hypothetical protein